MVTADSPVAGRTRFEPFEPRRKQEWRGLSIKERQPWLNRMFICYPEVKEFLSDVLENVELSLLTGRSFAMHLVAESGAGKTKLVEELTRFVTHWYGRQDPEKTILPVLILAVPFPCTPTELCYNILETLGDSYARGRGKRDQTEPLTETTARMINACEVRVVLFDNFQDIPSARRARGIEQLGIRLRDLIDKTQCTWVFLGTEKSREVVNAESQLIKRVPYVKTLRYFSLKDGKAKHFAKLLEKVDEWLPLAESSAAELKACSGIIFVATEGILDRIIKLLDRGWVGAVASGRESLIKADLKDAFKKVFGSDHPNPFDEGFVLRHLNQVHEPYERFGAASKPNQQTSDKVKNGRSK
jgi:hypothetical protein